MDNTPNLALPLLANKQALQTTFHDEALKKLDALVMLSVIDRDLSSPPPTPSDGDRYLVSAPGSGDPAWLDDRIVVYLDGNWTALAPRLGWTCYVEDEGVLIAWDGTAWQPALDVFGGGAANNLALLGVGTTADAANPFSAKLNNALWVAKTVAEGGDGDLRYKMRKESGANTLSVLFQDNFSGRAEIGLTGDDDFHFKVSPDGSAWIDALVIDHATGGVRLRAHETSVASASTCDIGTVASLKVSITGPTAITSLGTQANQLKLVRFAGALTLTHNATALILPGGVNIATAAGDTAIMASDASGNWRCLSYQRAAEGVGKRWTLTVVTASDAAWAVPAGTTEMMIEAFGGGGSGAGSATSTSQRRGGGGGGARCFKHYKGAIDATLNITIGAGGAAVMAASGGAAGNNGGTTTVAGSNLGTLTAGGGDGAPNSGAGGAGGTATGGDINQPGQAGQVQPVAIGVGCGEGGSSPLGGFGGRANVSMPGDIPGGGGSCSNHTGGSNSGAGARGEARIWTR